MKKSLQDQLEENLKAIERDIRLFHVRSTFLTVMMVLLFVGFVAIVTYLTGAK